MENYILQETTDKRFIHATKKPTIKKAWQELTGLERLEFLKKRLDFTTKESFIDKKDNMTSVYSFEGGYICFEVLNCNDWTPSFINYYKTN